MRFGIKELRQRRIDLKNEVEGILEGVDLTQGLTDEQRTKIAGIEEQSAKNEELIKVVEKQMDLDRNLPVVHTAKLVKENFEDDPKGGFKDHKEFLSSVIKAERIGSEDTRLVRYKVAVGSDEQKVGSDPYGGYLVPEGLVAGVLMVAPEDDPIGALVKKFPMAAPTVATNARVDKNHSSSVSGGLTVTRTPETDSPSSSRMAFEQVRFTAMKLVGLNYASEEILSDSPESFVALLSAGFSDEFAGALLNERINGTGAGQFLGVMNSGCLISVAKESGQTADTILKENIDKMTSRCWRYGRAVWLANHNTRPQLASLYQLVGSTGGSVVPYFKPGEGPGGVDILNGRPCYFTEYCQTLGDKGDILLGMWGEYLEATYKPMQQAESIHVRFVAHERTFKFWLRNDAKPWWTTYLTPKNGSTLSPFVTLNARA